MNTPINRQWKLTSRPVGMPKRSDFTYETLPAATPGDGQILVRTHYISLDPAMRGWMNDARSYVPPIGLGEVMRAGAVGEVVASHHPDWKAGDYAVGMFGMQDYAAVDGAVAQKVDAQLAPLPLFISVLGMPGLTAYFGTLDIGNPQPGQTVVVSAASGAVGALVGQIANSASTPVSITRTKILARVSPNIARRASMCISTMSAAKYWTSRWPGWRAGHAW